MKKLLLIVCFIFVVGVCAFGSFTPQAHAASTRADGTFSTVHSLANRVPCWWFHDVEIYNNTGELCFQGDGWTGVNIYNVTKIVDNGKLESFDCNGQWFLNLTADWSWTGSCSDITGFSING